MNAGITFCCIALPFVSLVDRLPIRRIPQWITLSLFRRLYCGRGRRPWDWTSHMNSRRRRRRRGSKPRRCLSRRGRGFRLRTAKKEVYTEDEREENQKQSTCIPLRIHHSPSQFFLLRTAL